MTKVQLTEKSDSVVINKSFVANEAKEAVKQFFRPITSSFEGHKSASSDRRHTDKESSLRGRHKG